MGVDVTLDIPNLDEIKSRLGSYSKKAPTALSRVINRVISNVQKNISVRIRTRYIIKAADIKKTLNVRKASRSSLYGYVSSKGVKIKLVKFKTNPKVPKPKDPPAIGYSAQKLKASALAPITGAFLARMKSGHVGMYQRVDKERLSIRELHGPAVSQMLGSETVIKYINEQAKKTLEKNIESQINNILKGGK